jgi:hypothetical protein
LNPISIFTAYFCNIHFNKGDSHYMHFHYQCFHTSAVLISIMRSINILSSATADTAAQAHWLVYAVSLTHPTTFTPGTTN